MQHFKEFGRQVSQLQSGTKSWKILTFFLRVRETVAHRPYTCPYPSPTPPTMFNTSTRYFPYVSTLYYVGKGAGGITAYSNFIWKTDNVWQLAQWTPQGHLSTMY